MKCLNCQKNTSNAKYCSRICANRVIRFRDDSWTNNEKQILKDKYGKIQIEPLELLLPNRTRKSIYHKASGLKLKGDNSLAHRKYVCNKAFFNYPTIQNCYWAGFIAADGCVTDSNDLIITLANKDEVILQSFKQQVGFTGDIKHRKQKSPRSNYVGTYSTLAFYGAHDWCKKLDRYWNITPRKSLTLQPPHLTNLQHIYAYIIGYFDGDGCFSTKDKNRYTMGFVGTSSVLYWIRSYLSDLIYDIDKSNRYNSLPKINGNVSTDKSYHMHWSGVRAAVLHTILRKQVDLVFRLPRKWEVDYDEIQ